MASPIDELKNRLQFALNERKMKPVELSEKTKIPKSSISQYMSGHAKPSGERVYLISNALDINEAWLLGFDAPMDKSAPVQEEKPDEAGLDENIIIYHRNGKIIKKKMSKEKMELLSSMLDALPDDDNPDL